jgi:hypothetical protein
MTIVVIVIVGKVVATIWYYRTPELFARDQMVIPENKLIKLKMTFEQFDKLDCQGLKTMRSQDVKHKVNDKRLRKYYRYVAPPFVALMQSDLKSYFEIIFDDGKIVEINKYNENGEFANKYDDLYCY